ncbi:MAG TPA: 16S rRNA processing protein RimM, partial [Sorangium sp.]|nr:16S rRNA processing protein RimM [Sorangium sp.]
YNPASEVLLGKPKVYLQPRAGEGRWVQLVSARQVPGTLLVRVAGVRDKAAAERLRGAELEVLRSALPPPDEDEFYHCDLQDCEVWLEGKPIGKVLRVNEYPTMDVLEVTGGARAYEVPLHADYVRDINVSDKRIELVTLDGLD